MDVTVDFVSGYVGGISGVIVGYPFDTVKVYLQTNKEKGNAFNIFRNIIKNESVRGLFKGISSPLYGTAMLNGILFGVNKSCTKLFSPEFHDTLLCQFISGGVAGFSQSIITCPMEYIKIKMQMNNLNNNYKFFNIFKTHLKTISGIKQLYSGMVVTLWRDIPGFAVYFSVYQSIINKYKYSTYEKTLKNDLLCTFIAGGFAGVVSWIPSYPIDSIKTRIQSNTNPNLCTKLIPFTKNVLKSGGFKNVNRGMALTLVRAFPVNAFTFVGAYCVLYLFDKTQKFQI